MRLLIDWFGFLGKGFPFFVWFCLKCFDLVLWVGDVEKTQTTLVPESGFVPEST